MEKFPMNSVDIELSGTNTQESTLDRYPELKLIRDRLQYITDIQECIARDIDDRLQIIYKYDNPMCKRDTPIIEPNSLTAEILICLDKLQMVTDVHEKNLMHLKEIV